MSRPFHLLRAQDELPHRDGQSQPARVGGRRSGSQKTFELEALGLI